MTKPNDVNKQTMSNNLKRLLNERNLSQAEFSRRLDVKPTTLSDWFNGKSYPRVNRIDQMANVLNVERTSLTEPRKESEQAYHDVIQIPVLGEIACGEPITAEQNIDEYMPAPAFITPNGTNFYLKAEGNSMEPTIKDGALVLIHEQPTVEDGEIAAVLIDNEATLKRVKHQGDTIILLPDNTTFNPILLTDDVDARILGKAIQVVNGL